MDEENQVETEQVEETGEAQTDDKPEAEEEPNQAGK